jgi:hypothetical protein
LINIQLFLKDNSLRDVVYHRLCVNTKFMSFV